jgi:hypothetical protein
MKGRTIIELVASVLIILFLYAAVSQLLFHNTYYTQINRAPFNSIFARIIAWALPACQLILAWLLWRPALRLAGLICSLVVVSIYTVYLFTMLPAGSHLACRCGELWQQASLEMNILFNLAVILLAALAIILTGRLKTNSPRLT